MTELKTSVRFVDAYSGLEVPVLMRIPLDGAPLFFAPAAVSPRRFFESMDEAVAVLGPSLTCPYTGERLRPVRDGDAVMFMGGWNPRCPVPRHEFLHYAAMRRGESSVPAETGRVEPVEDPVPAPLSREKPLTQEALDTVIEATEPKRSKTRRRR